MSGFDKLFTPIGSEMLTKRAEQTEMDLRFLVSVIVPVCLCAVSFSTLHYMITQTYIHKKMKLSESSVSNTTQKKNMADPFSYENINLLLPSNHQSFIHMKVYERGRFLDCPGPWRDVERSILTPLQWSFSSDVIFLII